MWKDQSQLPEPQDNDWHSKIDFMVERCIIAQNISTIYGFGVSVLAILYWISLYAFDHNVFSYIWDNTSRLSLLAIAVVPAAAGAASANILVHRMHNLRSDVFPLTIPSNRISTIWKSRQQLLIVLLGAACAPICFICFVWLWKIPVLGWMAAFLTMRCLLGLWIEIGLILRTLISLLSIGLCLVVMTRFMNGESVSTYLFLITTSCATFMPWSTVSLLPLAFLRQRINHASSMVSIRVSQVVMMAILPLLMQTPSVLEGLYKQILSPRTLALALIIFLIPALAYAISFTVYDARRALARRGRGLKRTEIIPILQRSALSRSSDEAQVASTTVTRPIFQTQDQRVLPAKTEPPKSDAANVLLSAGPETGSSPNWYELHIYFSLQCPSPLAAAFIYNIQCHVYHVSAGFFPGAIGTVIRHRVLMSQDNSILSSGRLLKSTSSDPLFVDLIVHTSVDRWNDTTLIVFGLFVDLEVQHAGRLVKTRIPSDKIFVFQHLNALFSSVSKVELHGLSESDLADSIRRASSSPKEYWSDNGNPQPQDKLVLYEDLYDIWNQHHTS
jgi:hypothetical protein